jgi:hypothetical protein
MTREQRRLKRQFESIEKLHPSLQGPVRSLQNNRWRLVRIPLGILCILGGVLSILPFLGIWMLPLGFLLLAIDLPFLQPTVNAILIRSRRRIAIWRRWWREWRKS